MSAPVAYADARATVVAQLATDLPEWNVYGYPPDTFDVPAVIVAFQESDRINPQTYRRDFIVGVFVQRVDIETAADLIDATVPTLVDSLDSVGHIQIGEVSRPQRVEWTDVNYIAIFVPVTIETTP